MSRPFLGSPSAWVGYSLFQNYPVRFAIDKHDGMVTTLTELDREQQDEFVMTVVTSASQLSERRTSFATVTVLVFDINDKPTMVFV